MPEMPSQRAIPALKQETPNRGVSPLLLLLTLLGAGIAALGARSWALDVGVLGDARVSPKRTRQLFNVASMEPVDLAMEAGRVFQIPGSGPTWLPGDHRIAFRVPAAAVGMVDLVDGRMGGQRLSFELWNETLDPVRPELAADRAGCRPGELSPCNAAGPDGGRVGARYRAGEYLLKVVVTNVVSVPGDRERVLRGQSGINPLPQRGFRPDPCDVREDPALGMLVGHAPEGVRDADACGFRTNGRTINGRVFSPANFMRLAPDGTPKFIVKCSWYVTVADGAPPSHCELQGHFGAWPLFLSVPSDRAPEWDATFERVRDYLARHTVSRTD